MEYFEVEGGNKLFGEAKIHGAKNSILPLLAASYLCKGKSVFTNCPRLMDKYESLDLENCSCQFIGHLQTNKVKYLIGKVDLIQSVDSFKLAKEISRLSEKQGLVTDILLEVNIGKEENKSGVMPEKLEELFDEVSALSGVRIRGLMCIPPICDNKEELMCYFSRMNDYFVDIQRKKLDNENNSMILSMGMSSDYYEAILCGATMVRVGSLLFGERIYK